MKIQFPKLNKSTGFYAGRGMKKRPHSNTLYYGDCVITAISNFLILKGWKPKKIRLIQEKLFKHPLYDEKEGNFPTSSIPELLEEILKAKPTLYILNKKLATNMKQEFPIQKHMEIGNDIPIKSFPCLGLTENYTYHTHLFVFFIKDNIIYIADNDGKIHKSDIHPLDGYIEMKLK